MKMLIFVGFYDPESGMIKLGAGINIPDPHHLSLDYRLVFYSLLNVDGRIRIQSLIQIREGKNFRLRILRIRNTAIYVNKGWPDKIMTPNFIYGTVPYCGLT
jgi:hypothetical protein